MVLGASFEVVVATTGRGALDLLGDTTLSLDLVVSDVGLPDIASHRLRSEVIRLRGDLPTIWISGHDRAEVTSRLGAPPRHFLMKPYSLEQLEEAVRDVLVSGRGPLAAAARDASISPAEESASGIAPLRGSAGRRR